MHRHKQEECFMKGVEYEIIKNHPSSHAVRRLLPQRKVSLSAVLTNLFSFVGQLFNIPNEILQLPGEIFQDVSNIVSGVINVVIPNCDEVKPNEVQFSLYNRENRDIPILLTSKNLKDHLKPAPIKIVIHGWISSGHTPVNVELKDAYLKRGDYNVILVDWEKQANANYAQAICSIKKISFIIGKFIFNFQSVGNIDLNNIHLIGHSLGAHMAGLVGQYIQRRTSGQKLYRITGLDAAGPGFLGFPKDTRLDASDALFVDAVHTNGAQFGYPINYGSVDFYPNCGLIQPGCLTNFEINFNSNSTTLLRQTSQTRNYNLIEWNNENKIYFFFQSVAVTTEAFGFSSKALIRKSLLGVVFGCVIYCTDVRLYLILNPESLWERTFL